eukprot:GHVS01098147.1.p1 GENE.GHVS01098147.1~~GHVS01098147.1.p1  ORF type:complete len:101 (+),score=0.20 GHVS01098147.1:991-1293(+)
MWSREGVSDVQILFEVVRDLKKVTNTPGDAGDGGALWLEPGCPGPAEQRESPVSGSTTLLGSFPRSDAAPMTSQNPQDPFAEPLRRRALEFFLHKFSFRT